MALMTLSSISSLNIKASMLTTNNGTIGFKCIREIILVSISKLIGINVMSYPHNRGTSGSRKGGRSNGQMYYVIC